MENPTHQSLVNVLGIHLKDLTASTFSMNGVEAKKQRFSVMKRCIFNEEITGEGWFQYKSVKYPDFLIGFSKAGRPVNGQRSAKRSKYRQFTLRELPERRRRKHRRNAILLRFKIIRLLRKKLLL